MIAWPGFKGGEQVKQLVCTRSCTVYDVKEPYTYSERAGHTQQKSRAHTTKEQDFRSKRAGLTERKSRTQAAGKRLFCNGRAFLQAVYKRRYRQ